MEGSPACSQAADLRHAVRALKAVGQQLTLEGLTITLRGIKLVQLPAHLERLPQLHSLELRYDPEVRKKANVYCLAAALATGCNITSTTSICLIYPGAD